MHGRRVSHNYPMTDIWTIGTAVGTIGSAVFVAWQVFLTRSSLVVTRKALESSEAVAIDAARARLDVGALHPSFNKGTRSLRISAKRGNSLRTKTQAFSYGSGSR